MNERLVDIAWYTVVAAVVAAIGCAGPNMRDKGGLLVPIAREGATDLEGGGRRFALLVGIDSFQDERFSRLKYAAEDARRMAEAISPTFQDIEVLTEPRSTTRASVLEAVARIARTADRPTDTVFMYFSTHGSLAARPGRPVERFLVMSDTRLDILNQTGLAVDKLLDVVDAMAAKKKVVVLATCHSGKGKSRLSDSLSKALAALKSGASGIEPLDRVSEATMVLTASAFGETARESDELKHDIYTAFFIKALDPGIGDRDGDGAVTVTEAHDYARARTYEYTRGMQRPTAETFVLGEDPIVLAGKRTRMPKPVLYSYAPSSEGLGVTVDGREKGVLPGGVAVPAGEHELEIRDSRTGKVLYKGRVDLKPGQVMDLAVMLPRPARLVLGAGFSYRVPLEPGVRDRFMPASPGAGAYIGVAGWPSRSLSMVLEVAYHGFQARVDGFGEELPFSAHWLDAGLKVSYSWELAEGLDLSAGAGASALWGFRKFDTATYRRNEYLTGFTAGIEPALRYRFESGLSLSTGMEIGAFGARLDNSYGLHPYLSLFLGMGY